MTGAEHYAEGERLLAEVDHQRLQIAPMVGSGQFPASEGMVIISALIGQAQAHFAAAQVAATIDSAAGGRWEPWLAVLGETPTPRPLL